MATEIERHPLAIAWDKWCESADGRKSLDYTALTAGPFLENRLNLAFMAGAAAGEQAGADAARRECAGIADDYDIDTDDPDRKFHTPARIANQIRARVEGEK